MTILMATIGGRTLPNLSASLAPTTETWVYNEPEFGVDYYTAGAITVTPVGGVSPYDYLWEVISGDAFLFGNPAGPFSQTGVGTVVRCRVTDAAGQTAYTNNCTIS